MSQTVDAIIIGAGPSGIALAHKLKHKLNFDNFTVYEKLDGVGGTWRSNTYPGCGCDVPTHLYSFSFNLNPNWSKELCDQKEILEYMESTVDKFGLRPHMKFKVACQGAKWLAEKKKWEVKFFDLTSSRVYTREANIFVSAVGGIAEPRKTKFPGMDDFKGAIFHTARWDHSYDYRGKRMAVIGNGCSAAQVVPSVVNDVAYIKQFARSPQWYHERPNRPFTAIEKGCFNYIPLWQRFHRFNLFRNNDALVSTYMAGDKAKKKRQAAEEHAKEYIYRMTPAKYHDFIVPKFPLGCKRRIFDPNYLESLHSKNLSLVAEGVSKIDQSGVISDSGVREEFDVIVLATGFEVSNFLASLEVIGANGVTLHNQWDEHRGAQAYMGTYVHNFPNLAILFGPNTFPAHNSVLFASEVQVDYIAKTLFRPVMDRRAYVVEVRQEAEDQFANEIDMELKGTVFSAGCSNWYINNAGRNSASWPGYASAYWFKTMFPRFRDYELRQGDSLWFFRRLLNSISDLTLSMYVVFWLVVVLGLWSTVQNYDKGSNPFRWLTAMVHPEQSRLVMERLH